MSELENFDSGERSSNSVINTVNVVDGRISNVSDQLNFAVEKSGTNVTSYSERASSATTTGMNFNITVPSMSTIIDRVVYVRSTLTFKVTGELEATKSLLASTKICLAPFPIHHLCNSIQITANQQTMSFDCRGLLPQVMRMLDKEVLDTYGSICPTQQDFYANYSNASTVGSSAYDNINSPFADFAEYLSNQVPRGAFVYSASNGTGGSAPVGGSSGTVEDTYITVHCIEPLIMSPMLLSSAFGRNVQGLYGLQNLKFLFNFANGQTRALRVLGEDADSNPFNVTLSNVSTDSWLDFVLITPQPSQAKLMKPRNVVPYMDLVRQTTQIGQSMPSVGPYPINSNNFQLSLIPDRVVICVRKIIDSQTAVDPDACLPIQSVSIFFNNRDGILSSAQPHQLYEMSRANGCNQSWQEFSGAAMVAGAPIVTSGSFLCLSFGKDICITEDYYAPSSLGQISFHATVNVINNTGAAINPNTYELVFMFMNSGVLTSELGTSTTLTGMLTKQMVLDASSKEIVSASHNRVYGSGWWSSVKSAFNKGHKLAKAVAPYAKDALSKSSDPRAARAVSAMNAVGMGRSGGAGYDLDSRLY